MLLAHGALDEFSHSLGPKRTLDPHCLVLAFDAAIVVSRQSMVDRLETLLEEITDLLRAGGHERWVVTSERFRAHALADMVSAKSDILGVYGAAGSFNDVVLHREGKALLEENERLDAAREELWRICRSSL